MRTLYHQPLDARSRKVRIALCEKGLDFALVLEPADRRREEFLGLNPAGDVPVLIDENGAVVSESVAICEYLEDAYPAPAILSNDPVQNAEIRRLAQWFDVKFAREVTDNLVGEKIGKRLSGAGGPSSEAIRAGLSNIDLHLTYIGYLMERRNWLAGDEMSLADIAAAAHISCVDYVGDVPWEKFDDAKNWYARIKSRPSFRPILADHIPGTPPPQHYADLDF
jgi:glutathione S-transferase